MLSDRFIRNAKPGLHADEGGLYLQVYPTGKRVFIARDQSGGKQTKKVLGHYPAMGLAEAREALAKRKSGRTSPTLNEAFDVYYRHLQTQFRDPEQTHRMFEKDVLPKLGAKEISAIPRADYASVLQAVVDRGSPIMANRLLVQLKRFLTFCEHRGWIESNPLFGVLRRNIGGRERSKERTLSFDEIEKLFTSLFTPGTKWALYGILLTGCRPSEILAISASGKIAETKTGAPHRVPLSIHVRSWLRMKPPSTPKDHRVLSHALRRQGKDFTPHDLRRTFASRLADLGVAPHVIEKLLNHRMVGVMAVYNRAEYWPERMAAQTLWGKKLKELRKRSRGS